MTNTPSEIALTCPHCHAELRSPNAPHRGWECGSEPREQSKICRIRELTAARAADAAEIERLRAERDELQEKNTRLRRILAHVPARVAIQAKESAGYGEAIVPMSYAEIREQSTNENDVREL